ncbi:hypothetical protein ElyMa_000080700 [Elysia marginata]|uniref:Uncharacterized protein n=1 Tax=Elysia marginata TaxID=1093978 RepID=A0AAV4EHJ0_9GAST|nr:hypothetical protein ElyMa_000080700 [Elysia marginata]
MDPPNIYSRLKSDTPSYLDLAAYRPHNNNYASREYGDTPDSAPRSQPTDTPVTSLPATNTVNVELSSEAGNTYNKKLQPQADENGRNELPVFVCVDLTLTYTF